MELGDGHGDDDSQNIIFVLQLEKRKEKNKMGSRQRYKSIEPFHVATQDTKWV
jgi:hypothetical protein